MLNVIQVVTLPSLQTRKKPFYVVGFEWLSMPKMGFNGPFNNVVNALYTCPMARLVAAGLLFDKFRLNKGTRLPPLPSAIQPCIRTPFLLPNPKGPAYVGSTLEITNCTPPFLPTMLSFWRVPHPKCRLLKQFFTNSNSAQVFTSAIIKVKFCPQAPL